MDNGQQVLSPAFMMEARLFYQNGLGSFLTDLQCGVKYMCTLEMPNTILQMTFYFSVSMFMQRLPATFQVCPAVVFFPNSIHTR